VKSRIIDEVGCDPFAEHSSEPEGQGIKINEVIGKNRIELDSQAGHIGCCMRLIGERNPAIERSIVEGI
jgi:hypothetical protein